MRGHFQLIGRLQHAAISKKRNYAARRRQFQFCALSGYAPSGDEMPVNPFAISLHFNDDRTCVAF
jgi:hypothetical protein